MSRWKRVAYGKPKDVKGVGTLMNVGSNVGTRIVQVFWLRPPAAGYKIARGKR